MKLLAIFSTLVIAASASIYGPSSLIYGPQLLNHDGTPVEPLANQIARAEHAKAHLEASLRAGVPHGAIYGPAPIAYGPHLVPAAAYGPPVIGPKGVPIELPANQIARAEHAKAVLEAELRNGDVAIAAGYPAVHPAVYPGYLAGIPRAVIAAEAGPVALTHEGVPVEPLANQIARAEHAQAYVKAAIAAAHSRKRRSIYGLAVAPGTVPLIGPNGVPEELPANQIARAEHAKAYAEAAARSGEVSAIYGPSIATYAPLSYSPAHSYPALHPDGQPIETPEVQHAKALHFQAQAEALARTASAVPIAPATYGYVPSPYYAPLSPYSIVANGLPLDEPRVAQAKAEHLALKAKIEAGAY